jgi:hypothetical protein
VKLIRFYSSKEAKTIEVDTDVYEESRTRFGAQITDGWECQQIRTGK